MRQARYQWDAAKAGLDYTSRQTEEQTRDGYQGVISQIAQVQALKQAVESNRVALQATEAGYGVGTKTVVDVLTAREALVQAETNYAQAKYGYLNDIVSLRLAAAISTAATIEEINGWLIEPRPASPNVPATPDSARTDAPGAAGFQRPPCTPERSIRCHRAAAATSPRSSGAIRSLHAAEAERPSRPPAARHRLSSPQQSRQRAAVGVDDRPTRARHALAPTAGRSRRVSWRASSRGIAHLDECTPLDSARAISGLLN